MSQGTSVDLPYFDWLFEQLQSPNSRVSKAMGRHVHWGYFSSRTSDASVASWAAAAETMTDRVCTAGRVGDGKRILDVGCGFGGTIGFLNDRLSGCELVGLNIDERQLVRARELVTARPGNTVRFVQGDACALPFDEGTFDVVLAVECIFHFPSRRTFFTEARRVLRTGGSLALSDFVVNGDKMDDMAAWAEANPSGDFYGVKSAAICADTYQRLAARAGLKTLSDDDITVNTMPTYECLKKLCKESNRQDGVTATAFLEEMSDRGFFEYRILSFEAESK